MRTSRSLVSPSDLATLPQGWSGRVGGRVLSTNSQTVVLADALAAVGFEVSDNSALPPIGSLVVCEVNKNADSMTCTMLEVLARPQFEATEHDRLLRRGVGKNLVLRSRSLELVRSWFKEHHFLEVDTAQRVPSPGLDLHLDAFSSEEAYLITSPEYQMKRLLVGGLPRIYQIVHCFRSGECGDWHNPEFLMLEWYRAFCGLEEVMRDTEEIVAHLVCGLCGEPALTVNQRVIDLSVPFERLTVCEAFQRYAGVASEQVLRWAAEDDDEFFRVLVSSVEPQIALSSRPVFLTDYPAQQASLSRLRPSDPRFCERFELYVGGVELCNGFGELADPEEQHLRLRRDVDRRREQGKPVYPIDNRFLQALREGMPPSGGNALGLDRLLALCVGASCLGEVIPFPVGWL